MGTSASSSGPGGGVPMVPPWVPDPGDVAKQGDDGAAAPVGVPVAPSARFGGARRALGDFARGGSNDSLRKGLGRYASRGLGGSRTAARRMGGAAVRSGGLYGALRSLSGSPTTDGAPLDPASLSGLSAREVIDAIVEFVSPSDGSQDAESSQHAIAAALSDLLADQPDVDLGALTSEEIAWVVERHLVYEIHYRVQLDVGKSVIDNAPSPATAMRRLDEIRDYIQETVASAFRERRSNGSPLTNAEATKLANSVLEDTFAVFEEYVE